MTKQILNTTLKFFLVLSACCYVACDPVDEGDRYIEIQRVAVERNVLLEEFTGQNCSNCPTAHRVIEALESQYGESLVSVSIHAGSFAYPEGSMEPFQTFKTAEGDAYANMWGIQDYPSGVVNRRSGILLNDAWALSVYNELQRSTPLEITLDSHLNSENDSLVIATTLASSQALNGKLQLWVVEDSIVSLQLDGSDLLPAYVHNNVYRASVNGVGGETVEVVPAVPATLVHSVALKSRWNAQNLRVVGFVYNASEVLQVAQANVK